MVASQSQQQKQQMDVTKQVVKFHECLQNRAILCMLPNVKLSSLIIKVI